MTPVEPPVTAPVSATIASSREVSAGERRLPVPGREPVIFFDGVCGLCSAWVDFVIARDKQARFHFGALQGQTARDWLQMTPETSLDSVALADADGIHRMSDAVWRILTQLGGVWRPLGWLLRVIPRPLRNLGYDLIARRRYRWFGKKETCRL